VLMLDGVDPLGRYRPFCDRCGDKLASSAVRLDDARRLAQAHAQRTHHDVRIEPWDSFALIELVTRNEDGGPFAGMPPWPEAPASGVRDDCPTDYRPGCSCRLCDAARAQRDR
jgi:hypothetical protein